MDLIFLISGNTEDPKIAKSILKGCVNIISRILSLTSSKVFDNHFKIFLRILESCSISLKRLKTESESYRTDQDIEVATDLTTAALRTLAILSKTNFDFQRDEKLKKVVKDIVNIDIKTYKNRSILLQACSEERFVRIHNVFWAYFVNSCIPVQICGQIKGSRVTRCNTRGDASRRQLIVFFTKNSRRCLLCCFKL